MKLATLVIDISGDDAILHQVFLRLVVIGN